MRKGRARIDPHDPERLAERLDRSGGENACWPWTGDRTPRGYGQISTYWNGQRKRFYVHRISYEIAYGPIPSGMYICHRCDNPPCANPRHLFAGTSAENARDMLSKRRNRPVSPRGERSHLAKITEDQARSILSASAAGMSIRDLAAQYALSYQGVWGVVHGKSWRWLHS